MSSIDQQFVEFVVKSLVSKPEAVQIERRIDEKGVLLELTVDPEDLGRVIGKRGATAQSLRTLLRALGTKNDARYNLKIVDNGDDRAASDNVGAASSNDDSTQSDSQGDDRAAYVANQGDDSQQTQSSEGFDNDDSARASDAYAEKTHEKSTDDSMASRTRRELADLDDLDV